MASGFPISAGHVNVRTSEALYQACRFPLRPDVQGRILAEASPMAAKMVSKKYMSLTREDWERVRVQVMRWCLAVKLARNFESFGRLLEATCDRDIVESSRRDSFWGAVPDGNGRLIGVNALGRLLMELRHRYTSPQRYHQLFVPTPAIQSFVLLGDPIEPVDFRQAFLDRRVDEWR
jgi:ribA/ribD-fused uncharacterized protein